MHFINVYKYRVEFCHVCVPFVLDTDVVIDRVTLTVDVFCLTVLIWKVRLSVLLPEGVPDCVSSLDAVIGAFWRAMASAFWRAMASAFCLG